MTYSSPGERSHLRPFHADLTIIDTLQVLPPSKASSLLPTHHNSSLHFIINLSEKPIKVITDFQISLKMDSQNLQIPPVSMAAKTVGVPIYCVVM